MAYRLLLRKNLGLNASIHSCRSTNFIERRLLPGLSTINFSGKFSTSKDDPKKTAQALIDSLPNNNYISKPAMLSAAAALGITAIANELYVVNEETIVAFCLIVTFWASAKFIGPLYKGWAESQTTKIHDILASARSEHTSAVLDRINVVKGYTNVVDTTKSLFNMSKETAKLEAQAHQLAQKTGLAAEAKNVLEALLRHESQVKQKQQRELAEMVISRTEKALEDPKILRQILDQSVAEVERLIATPRKA